MKRLLPRAHRRTIAGLLVSLATVVLTMAACDESTESACKVDTDCPQGNICREQRCGPTTAEAGPPPDAAPISCSSDGLSCNTADECCTRLCSSGRCGAPPPPPAPSCRGIYELCQNDCCEGLSCLSGTCR